MASRRRAALSLVLIVSLSVAARAQTTAGAPGDTTKQALIHDLLTLTHAVDQAVASMEAALPAQRAANPRVPPIFWDRFLTQVRTRRGDLESMMVAAYDSHLSSDDVRQIIAFYRTPVGQKLVVELPAITRETMQAGQLWGAQIARSVAAQLAKEGTPVPPRL